MLRPRFAPHPTNRPRGPCCPPQRLFPASFIGLVRVCNHKAADCLLVKHEAAASQRDRCEDAVAAARQQAKVLWAGPAEAGAGAKGAGDAPSGGSSTSSKQAANASAKLSKAEEQLAKWQQRTAELEAQLLAAQQAALAQPLGTAFIALFRCANSRHTRCSGCYGWRSDMRALAGCCWRCTPRLLQASLSEPPSHTSTVRACPLLLCFLQDAGCAVHVDGPRRRRQRGAALGQLLSGSLPRAR